MKPVFHGMLGRTHTPEARAKLRAAHLGRKQSAEQIENSRKARIGLKRSAQYRRVLSASKMGALNPQFGKPRPEEVRARIAKGLTGFKHSPAFAEAIRERIRKNGVATAKLTLDQVIEIRAKRGEPRAPIAAHYQVSKATVSAIWAGRRWPVAGLQDKVISF